MISRDIRHVPLPEYASVEILVPEWPAARDTLERCLPQAITMAPRPNQPSRIEVSSAWVVDLLCLAPESANKILLARLRAWLQHFGESENLECYTHFLGQPVDRRTLRDMNALLATHELTRRSVGWHTMHEALQHFMGIKPWGPVQHIRMDVSVERP